MSNVTLLKLLGLLSSAVIGLMLTHNPNYQKGATLIYDPLGVTVTSTTLPVHLVSANQSTTVVLALTQNSSGTILFGLVAANVQDQIFINNTGDFVLTFPNQSSSFNFTLANGHCLLCTISLEPVITAAGSYPFTLLATIDLNGNRLTGTATGTILAQ